MTDHIHDWQPVNRMQAVYRCSECGIMGYKPLGRRSGLNPQIVPYKCRHVGCGEPVVVLWPTVRAHKRHEPSCAAHRKDKPGV